MQKKVNDILVQLINQLVPARSSMEQRENICRTTKLSYSTLRMARSRNGMSADTLIKLLLAHGVAPENLVHLPRTQPSKVSKSLTQWNRIGLNLGDRERENVMKLIALITREWKSKKEA